MTQKEVAALGVSRVSGICSLVSDATAETCLDARVVRSNDYVVGILPAARQALSAIARLPRNQLQATFLSSFSAFLDVLPCLRDAVNTFLCGEYRSTFEVRGQRKWTTVALFTFLEEEEEEAWCSLVRSLLEWLLPNDYQIRFVRRRSQSLGIFPNRVLI